MVMDMTFWYVSVLSPKPSLNTQLLSVVLKPSTMTQSVLSHS